MTEGVAGVGRPRDSRIDGSLRTAAADIMATTGYGDLTIEAVCRAAGCTRRTFFLRYESIDDLVLDVLTRRFGTNEVLPTGDLASDLSALQAQEAEMLRDPLMSNSLAGLFEACRRSPRLRQRYIDEFVTPRRKSVERVLQQDRVPGGAADSAAMIDDVLLGPLLSRVLVFGGDQLTDELVAMTVRLALDELSRQARP